MAKKSSDWVENLLCVIKEHIENRTYRLTDHALEEMENDNLNVSDVMYVLMHGRHEKSKTVFSTKHQSWNYAIVGKTIDSLEVRVIIAFEGRMMVVTVFVQGKLKRKK
jgi:hypothetical protein